MTGMDRRQFPRVALAIDVDFSSGHNFYLGRTRDISTGGLFVEANVGLKVGAIVQIQLSLLKKRFTVTGEVVWAVANKLGETTGVGVRFTNLSEAHRRTIEAFMALRRPIDFEIESADEVVESNRGPTKGPPPLPKN